MAAERAAGTGSGLERAPYGRHDGYGERHRNGGQRDGRDGHAPEAMAAYAGETYYERPALKPSPWGWLVVSYFFIGGIAGAAQVIATIADFAGGRRDRGLVRSGRYLALAGVLASPILLIADLRTPRRWYNMLRIFRGSSAMSIGAWTLSAFGTFSGLAALGQLLSDGTGATILRLTTRIVGLPAALAGALMSVYTGTLLAATSIPLWAAGARLLPALFGASAVATGTAALSLTQAGEADGAAGRLEPLALAASGTELALALALERQWRRRGVSGAMQDRRLAATYRIGAIGAGMALPLALHASQIRRRRRSRTLSLLAAVATLGGGYALRAALVLGGRASAARPRDYFQFTQAPSDGASAQRAAEVRA